MQQTTLAIDSTTTLNDGNAMPLLGLGVFQIQDEQQCISAIHAAIDCGYRHIDTAVGYQNEEQVGKAVSSASLDRQSLFITTKVVPANVRKRPVQDIVEDSLRKLRSEYLDLCLIHWPVREGTERDFEELVRLQGEGKIRSVGVSNMTVQRFEKQFFKRTQAFPAVNQFERHPYHANNELLDYCRKKGIQPEAYSPLAQSNALSDSELNAIGNDHGKSAAQVMIRWQLQQGVVVIPKSSNPRRIAENADVFDFKLSPQEMERINKLNTDSSIITWRPEDEWF